MKMRDVFARWGVVLRWTAYAALCVALVYGYARGPAARADENGAAPAADEAKTPPEKPPVAGPLSAKQAEQLADEALAKDEEIKKPAAAAVEKPRFDLIKEVLDRPEHMWAVWLILLLSLMAMATAIERILGLRRRRVIPSELVAALKTLARQKSGMDPREAMLLCRQYPSAAATVVKTMLQKVGRPIAEIEHAVSEASEREASRVYANVRWQTLTFNVAPMLGLAGTVYGMLLAFFTTANLSLSENRMANLATGIYAALICTFAGLVVAIPAGVLAQLFEGRILKLFRELDDLMLTLIPQLERFEGRGVPHKGRAEPVAEKPAEAVEPDTVRLPDRPAQETFQTN